MKKILYVTFLLLLCSCSHSLKKEAIKQMEKTVRELAKDPSSVQINNLNVLFDDDSVCVMQFTFSAKNGFGAITSSKCEYVYLIYNDSIGTKREMFYELDKEHESVLKYPKEQYQEKKWGKGSYVDRLSDEEKKAYLIHSWARLMSIWSSRIVNENEDKVENW